MKVAPVSADLLIKLALVAAVVGGAWYLANRARAALGGLVPDVGAWADRAGAFVGDLGDSAADTFWTAENWARDVHGGRTPIDQVVDVYDFGARHASTTLNPASPENFIYRGVNAVGGSVSGVSDFSLGSWLYDVFNPAPPAAHPPDPVQQIRRIDNALGY